jgi:hypothetical protein
MDGSQIDEVMQQQDGVEEGNEEEGAIVAASPDAPAARLMEGLQNHGESSERYVLIYCSILELGPGQLFVQ